MTPPDAVAQRDRTLRDVLGRFATGVTIVTGVNGDGSPAGLTVNSFTSVSLAPPLILWCLRRSSTSRAAFAPGRPFAVNILATDQLDLARRFAGPPGERFTAVRWRGGPYGLALFDGSVAHLICRQEQRLRQGDHLIIIGAVEHYAAAPGRPLLFADGCFQDGCFQDG
jgi:flavin reductase (DIM6/NTAB) family NADH-FMN oxidoreductase RutF